MLEWMNEIDECIPGKENPMDIYVCISWHRSVIKVHHISSMNLLWEIQMWHMMYRIKYNSVSKNSV